MATNEWPADRFRDLMRAAQKSDMTLDRAAVDNQPELAITAADVAAINWQFRDP